MRSRSRKMSATVLAAALTASAGLAACSSGSSTATSSPSTSDKAMSSQTSMGASDGTSARPTASKNIVEIASSNPEFSTLVAAVKAAGLVKTLEGSGPFTVFAPTDQAFAALPPGTVENLVKPANKSQLTSILTYHVVPGAYTSSNLPSGSVKTVNGATVTVRQNGDKVELVDGKGNVVRVTTADIKASNGVIHVISGVLMPPSS